MINLIRRIINKILCKYNCLYYVSNLDRLPEPLTKEEEEKLILDFHNGDLKAKKKNIPTISVLTCARDGTLKIP